MANSSRATRSVTRSQSRAPSASAPVPSIEEDMQRAGPSAFRPTIPVAVSTGYGSPGKLGSPSRRLRAQSATGGDLAADVGQRLARLSEESGVDDDDHVTPAEPVVPRAEQKKSERRQRGKEHVTGNTSFGVEAVVGKAAAVEVVRPAPAAENARPAPTRHARRRGTSPPVGGGFWSSWCTILAFLAFWLLLIPFLAGILAITRRVPWYETAKSLATFGAFPAPSRFVPSYSGEYTPVPDMHDLRNGLVSTSDFSKLRSDLNGDIKGIRSDVTDLRSHVNTVSSNIPPKGGATTHFAGGLPAHIVPSYGATRVNHFSNNLGAVVDPYLTSPSRSEIIHYENILLRWLYPKGESIPQTFTPTEALSPWEDLGDCWCTPSSESSNGLAQLGVLLPQPLIPTDLIIEHIEKDRTLDSDSTPKEFELIIQVHDADARAKIAAAAKKWLNEGPNQLSPQEESFRWDTPRELDETWVKVGRWVYDINSKQNIQIFRIPGWLADLGSFGTSKVVVRTRSNWGDAAYTCFYRLKLFGHLVKS